MTYCNISYIDIIYITDVLNLTVNFMKNLSLKNWAIYDIRLGINWISIIVTLSLKRKKERKKGKISL